MIETLIIDEKFNPTQAMPYYDIEQMWDAISDRVVNAHNHDTFAEHIKYVPLQSWVCTDTRVGLFAYFLDEEFVGISFQMYRKSDTEFFWKDVESRNKVKQFIEQNCIDTDDRVVETINDSILYGIQDAIHTIMIDRERFEQSYKANG